MPLGTALPPPVKTFAAQNGQTWPGQGTRTPYGQDGQNIYQAKTGVLSAQSGQYDAEDALLAAQRAALNAGRATLGYSKAVTDASRSYLGERQRGLGERTNEERTLQAARGDTANLSAVEMVNRGNKAGDWRFSAAGAQAPSEMVMPVGATSSNSGIRPATISNADRLTTTYKDADTLRNLGLEGSQLSVEGARLAEEGARNNEADVNFGVKEAGLNVTGANNRVQRARLASDVAEMPPAADLVYDAESGTFLTRDQQRLQNTGNDYKFNAELQKYGLPAYMTQRQINERTDPDGNLRLDDGRKLDPQTGNLWMPRQGEVEGYWQDPKTGNTFEKYVDPGGNVHDSWSDKKTGNRYVVMNPAKGTGYWLSPQGYFLSADGIWRNPVTGQAIYSGTGEPYGRGSTGSTIVIPYGGTPDAGTKPYQTPPGDWWR